MKIENAEVMRTRIEDITDKKFDFLTARAVAYADKLIPRAYPLLKK
jgi:16S rRNA G527 N7-methylase RsmG